MAQAYMLFIESACNHIILNRAQLIGSCCISIQWARCSNFRYLVSVI